MNENLILHILDRFGIKPLAILRASALGIQGHKDERIFQMCEETGADTYLSGRGAANYHEPYEYMLHGIDLILHRLRAGPVPAALRGVHPEPVCAGLHFQLRI